MAQPVKITTGFLIQLAQDENQMKQLYFDTKYNAWRNQFLKDNGIKINSSHNKKIALLEKYFEFEGENENRKIKMTTPPPTPKVEAVYKTEVVTPATIFKKEVTKQVLVTPEVPEQPQQPIPVFKSPYSTMDEYEKEMKALVESETTMVI